MQSDRGEFPLSTEDEQKAAALAEEFYALLGDYARANKCLIEAKTLREFSVTYPLNYMLLQQRLPSKQRQLNVNDIVRGPPVMMPENSAVRRIDPRCLGSVEDLPEKKQDSQSAEQTVKEYISTLPMAMNLYFYGVVFATQGDFVTAGLNAVLVRTSESGVAFKEIQKQSDQAREQYNVIFRRAMSLLTVERVKQTFEAAEKKNPQFVGYINALTTLETMKIVTPWNVKNREDAVISIKEVHDHIFSENPNMEDAERERAYAKLQKECEERMEEIAATEAYEAYQQAKASLRKFVCPTLEDSKLQQEYIAAIEQAYQEFLDSDQPESERVIYERLTAQCQQYYQNLIVRQGMLAMQLIYQLANKPYENNQAFLALRSNLIDLVRTLVKEGMGGDEVMPVFINAMGPVLQQQFPGLVENNNVISVLVDIPSDAFLPAEIRKRDPNEETEEQLQLRAAEESIANQGYYAYSTCVSALLDFRSTYLWEQFRQGKSIQPEEVSYDEVHGALRAAVRDLENNNVDVRAVKQLLAKRLDLGTNEEVKNLFINQLRLLGRVFAGLNRPASDKGKEEMNAPTRVTYAEVAAPHDAIREALPLPVLQTQLRKISEALAEGQFDPVVKELFVLYELLQRLKPWAKLNNVENRELSIDAVNNLIQEHYTELRGLLDENIFRNAVILQGAVNQTLENMRLEENNASNVAMTEVMMTSAGMLKLFLNMSGAGGLSSQGMDISFKKDIVPHVATMHEIMGRMEEQVQDLKAACEGYLEHLAKDIEKLYPRVFKKLPDEVRIMHRSHIQRQDGKLDFEAYKTVVSGMAADEREDEIDERYRLAVRKYEAVNEMYAKLHKGQNPVKLINFRKSFNDHRKLIETRRDNAATTFLKVVASALLSFISPLLAYALWRVHGEDANRKISKILHSSERKPGKS